ncbi:MAG: hypothetical protein GXO35_07585 [Gammaproteobacteria bacterium]|nr:hypothetical protein [Gammaproteobacteria bacterium]
MTPRKKAAEVELKKLEQAEKTRNDALKNVHTGGDYIIQDGKAINKSEEVEKAKE